MSRKEGSQESQEDPRLATLQLKGSIVILVIGSVMAICRLDILCVMTFVLLATIVLIFQLACKNSEFIMEKMKHKEAKQDAEDICEDDDISNGML